MNKLLDLVVKVVFGIFCYGVICGTAKLTFEIIVKVVGKLTGKNY